MKILHESILVTILSCIIWKSYGDNQCFAYECSQDITTCAIKMNQTVYLNPNACNSDQECFFFGGYNSIGGLPVEGASCEKKIDRTFPSTYYPGYNCRFQKVPGLCTFGSKYCNSNGVCEGGTLNEQCSRTSDCYFGFYCNQFGLCVPSRKENETCTSNQACQTGYLCNFAETASMYGKCTPFLSLETDYQVLPQYNMNNYEQIGNEKLCSSGWYNRTTGKCFAGVKSLQKGKVCTSDLDCPTTISDIFAQCKCGFSTSGQKYCDIEGNDDEWISVRDAFSNYSSGLKNCHQGDLFGECFFNPSFLDWKCKEIKARLYVLFIDNPPCMDGIIAQHPLFAEYNYYCKACDYKITFMIIAVCLAFILLLTLQ